MTSRLLPLSVPRRSILPIIGLWLMTLAPACMALSCRQGTSSSGNVVQTISLPGNIRVPVGNLSAGKLLWRSDNQTVTFTCFDTEHNWKGEYAYIYIDPNKDLLRLSATVPSIQVGVTYNGVDYTYKENQKIKIDNSGTSPSPWGPLGKAKPRTSTISFSLFVKATGQSPPASGKVSASGTYKVFQIDGANGLNQSRPNANYSVYINGLQNINFIACNPKITVNANNGNYVDFGSLSAQYANAGSVAKTVPFNVIADTSSQEAGQDCPNLTLKATFSTTQQVTDNSTTIMPVMDDSGQSATGFGITIADDQSPNTPIPMNTTIPFGVVNGNQVTHKFDASLKWLNKQPETGKFHADANIDVTFQ